MAKAARKVSAVSWIAMFMLGVVAFLAGRMSIAPSNQLPPAVVPRADMTKLPAMPSSALAAQAWRPEDKLNLPAEGWDGQGGGWPTPFHVFFHEYLNVDGPLAHKWTPYFNAYHRHFERYRGKNVTFVEVGVQSGGSALMWRWYFGPGFKYIGIDINPETQRFDTAPWIEIVIGDTEKPAFWQKFKKDHPEKPDIYLDDGGHTMKQMLASYKYYYDHVKMGGIYAVEDLHTCYWTAWGGNPNPAVPLPRHRTPTFIEFTHRMIDWLHSHRFTETQPISNKTRAYRAANQAQMTKFVSTAGSIHFYESIVFVEKTGELKNRPIALKSGSQHIPYTAEKPYSGFKFDFSKLKKVKMFAEVL